MFIPPEVFSRAVTRAVFREEIQKLKTTCPACETEQVQLMDSGYDDGRIKFRCRHCSCEFSKLIKVELPDLYRSGMV